MRWAPLLVLAGCSGGAPLDGGAAETGPRDAILDAGADDAEPLDAEGWMPGDPLLGDPELTPTLDGAALLQGVEVRWYAGPQGGFHLFAGLEIARAAVADLDAAALAATIDRYELRAERDQRLLASVQRTGRLVENGEVFQTGGVLLVLESSETPQVIAGQVLIYTVTVRRPDGRRYTARVYLTTQCCN